MKMLKYNLQMFAEGGDGGDAAGAADDVNAEVNEQLERDAKWKEAINGEYRDHYQRAIKDVVDKRFKHVNELQERLDRRENLDSFLAARYGLSADDPDAILQALQNDDALFEQEAAERGLSTDQLKEVKRLEAENAALQREHDRAEAQRATQQIYDDWVRQADALKTQFPEFDLTMELDNPQFSSLLQAGIPLEHAFKVVHMDELVGGVAAYTAQNIASQVTDGIRAKGMRPVENGIGRASSPVKEVIDVSKMTTDEMKNIIDRVKNGERIVL